MKRKLRSFFKFAKKNEESKATSVLYLTKFTLLCVLLFSNGISYSQTACDVINAGDDVTIDCDAGDVELEATIMTVPHANTSSYMIAEPICPLPPVTGGTPTGLVIDDLWSNVINIPFDFNYFQNDYSALVVGANGQISFDTSLANTGNGWSISPTDLLPTTSANFPLNTIYGAFHDLHPGVNPRPDAINYFVTGEAPFRMFVLNFDEVPHFSCTTLVTTQQVVLYESLNVIEVSIYDKPVCSGWNGGLATLGIMGNNLSEFAVPDGRNTGVWTASDETWRFLPNGDPNISYDFEWRDEDGNVIGTDHAITVAPSVTTTYTAVMTFQLPDGTFDSISDDVTVTVLGSNFTVDIGDDQSFCDVDSYEIVSEIIGGNPDDAVYEWFLDGVSLGVDTPNLVVTQSGLYELEVTIIDCSAFASVMIEFNENPEIDLGSNFETCYETSVFLDASPSNYDEADVSFEWFLNGADLGLTDAVIEAEDYGTYSVIVTAGICSSEDSIVISPRGDLEVALSAPISSCTDETVTITASTEEPGVTYTWFANGDVMDGQTGSSITVTTPSESSNLSLIYSVEITKGECFGTAEVEISVLKCVISQGISPGGSIGQNDFLDLEFLANRTGITNLKIYNRNGILVYERQNYVNEWGGQDKNENELPTGTYFFLLNFAGEDPVYGTQHNGWVYINRDAN